MQETAEYPAGVNMETGEIESLGREVEEGFIDQGDEDAPVLPVYANPTQQGVESTWSELDQVEDRLYLKRGAIVHAASLAGIYGDRAVEQLAGKSGSSLSTLKDWMATYRRLLDLKESRRSAILALDVRYGHLRVCNAVKDDAVYTRLLTKAADKRWNVGELAAAVQAWRDRQRPATPEPPDTEDPEEGEEPTGARHSAREHDSRSELAAQMLTKFLEYADRRYGVRFAHRDEKARLKPLKAIGLSAEMIVGDFIDEEFAD